MKVGELKAMMRKAKKGMPKLTNEERAYLNKIKMSKSVSLKDIKELEREYQKTMEYIAEEFWGDKIPPEVKERIKEVSAELGVGVSYPRLRIEIQKIIGEYENVSAPFDDFRMLRIAKETMEYLGDW